MRRFTLTVLARDGGGEETTGRIRVNVLDINDNPPLFQKEAYVGSLRENEQAVQAVARIRVILTGKIHWISVTTLLILVSYEHVENLFAVDVLQIKWSCSWKYILDWMQQACTS